MLNMSHKHGSKVQVKPHILGWYYSISYSMGKKIVFFMDNYLAHSVY